MSELGFDHQASRHKGPSNQKKALVLCFDGTGNKFQGNDADSNIIKIFSMLDREDRNLFAYYQPGIGTYVEHSKLSKTGRLDRLRSWWTKTKDMAVGSSFADHIQGGYRFLMRYYQDGDDIYFFGFSRGAYTARFLARMLDCVGLLSAGNEEMFRFAWKAFSQWETRLEETEEQQHKKKELWEFLKRFRETFARPIKRIRFIGLFDTVNSVPRFESAWLQRTKFPYGARSSARVIRQAVALNERRAKFRVDLITGSTSQSDEQKNAHPRRPSHVDKGIGKLNGNDHVGVPESGNPQQHLTRESTRFDTRMKRKGPSSRAVSRQPSTSSLNSNVVLKETLTNNADDSDDDDAPQDIQEVWFPGDHGDIGGGWPKAPGVKVNVSHIPLIWMLREARKAGLPCDEEALQQACYSLEDTNQPGDHPAGPTIQVDGQPIPEDSRYDHDEYRNRFMDLVSEGSTKALVHDSLTFGQHGISPFAVFGYRVMEWMPFRRMDLRDDGKWAPIRWPLPRGEVRDLPDNAVIHNTALKRMDFDEKWRPGNLIIGGGGRGVIHAPVEAGKGHWKVLREPGHPVGEVWIRDVEKTRAEVERRLTEKGDSVAKAKNGTGLGAAKVGA